MNKEKQIEEMAKKVISDICPFYKEYGTCKQCNTKLDIGDEPCYWEYMAKAIVRYGYRKASEVALEAIDKFQSDIMRIFIDMCCGNDYNKINLLQIGDTIDSIYDSHIAELKKKYTEEGK
jgi:hypothetical protein